MNLPTPTTTAKQLAAMQEELAALRQDIHHLAAAQRERDAFFEEMQPVLKEVMATATDRLQTLDERGYFTFAREMARVVDRVVQSYGEDDVRALGDNIVRIMDTVRALTQPSVLAVASEASEVIEHADELEPTGLFGAMRASRDEDVRRGMALMLGILRSVGRGVREMEAADRETAPAPARAPAARRAPAPAAPRPAAAAVAAPTPAPAPVAGAPFDAAGFLADPAQWSPDLARAIAASLGIGLEERHWQVVTAARNDYLETGTSPNIRRLTKITDATTKEVYALFPRAPGMTIARIAGIPKPAGCV
jgi:tRNA 2-thiouridine synthesizing protein E